MESSGPHSKIAPDGPVRPKSFETVLAALSIFERLRVDEIGRIARRFKLVELEKAGTIGFAKSVDAARIVVVVTGTIDLFVTTSAGVLESTLEAGDRFGEMPLLSGVPQEMKVVAEDGAVLALLDRAELDAILEEFPVVALSLAVVSDGGSFLKIDDSMHDPLDRAMVVCGNGSEADAAHQFED